MELEKLLEKEHSKRQCERIVKYIGKDPDKFSVLMRLFLQSDYRITQRASLPLSHCVQYHPELIKPYFKILLDNLDKRGLHDAVVRNTLRILQALEIPKKYQGKLMSRCFEFLTDPETAIAIKAFSLSLLHKLSHQYPEIIPEVRLIIEDQWEQATPAFRSRARAFNKGAGS